MSGTLQRGMWVGWLLCAVLLTWAMPVAGQTMLTNDSALYARIVRLSHNADATKNGNIVVAVTAFPSSGTEASIYSSADGVTFAKIGAVTDSDFSGGLCCGTLYELPSQVGTLPAGTLLWSGSVGQTSTTQAMQLKVYASEDQGKTWSYLSNCATGSKPGTTGGGLWEPQFTVANDGALVCFFSDETVSGHSQLLRQVRSYNGLTWQDSTYTVASTVQADRPGMAVVTKLPSGLYFMSYELCGPAACTVFTRTSTDGWNWGDATNMGDRVVTADGSWLEHAPTNAWAPSAASANGTILLVGQMMYSSSGAVASGNGITVLTNHSADGTGTWNTMPAPVKVPTAYDNYCPNYSSPLLPSPDGQSVLEFASNYSGSVCKMYYGSSAILAGTLTPILTVTPSSTNITTGQTVSVSVSVTGTAGGPSPVGTVTLTDGASYTSSAATLTNGSVTFTVPAETLAAGAVTLTATYSGDANYTFASGTSAITVVQAAKPGFTVSGGNLSLKAGATTGNSISITITPTNGFTGNVSFTAQIVSGPGSSILNYPSLSFGGTSPVSITGTSSGSATLTILSTGKSTAAVRSPSGPLHTTGVASLALLCFPPLCLGSRRARRSRLLWLLPFLAMCFSLTACGSGTGSSTSQNQTSTPAGTYTISILGSSGSVSATGTVVLTIQ
jgi:hypothetical protein